MKKQIIFTFAFILYSFTGHASSSSSSFSSSSSSSSSSSHSYSDYPEDDTLCFNTGRATDNEFYPDFRFYFTPQALTDGCAIALMGDIGKRNYRINGTLGYFFTDFLRFKVSSEYLMQKIGYNFATGRIHKWVQQGAGGMAFQYLFNDSWISNLEFYGTVAYSPGHLLSTLECIDEAEIFRYIAGANTVGLGIAATLHPWRCADFKMFLDYDRLQYRQRYHSNHYLMGTGFGFELNQQLICNLNLDLRVEFRRPFNYFKALINWNPPLISQDSQSFLGNWNVGFFWEYTHGKHNLPCVTTAGFELAYDLCTKRPNPNLTGADTYWPATKDYDGTFAPCFEVPYTSSSDEISCALAEWISDPAVFYPIVLAIPERKTVNPCFRPVSFPIPDQVVSGIGGYILDVTSYFVKIKDEPYTYSAHGLPERSKINPKTGVIGGINPSDEQVHRVTIIASTSCGETRRTFLVLYLP